MWSSNQPSTKVTLNQYYARQATNLLPMIAFTTTVVNMSEMFQPKLCKSTNLAMCICNSVQNAGFVKVDILYKH